MVLFTSEQSKCILKYYVKTESVAELRRRRRNDSRTQPSWRVKLQAYVLSVSLTEGCGITSADLEDVSVQLAMEVLRRCYGPSHTFCLRKSVKQVGVSKPPSIAA